MCVLSNTVSFNLTIDQLLDQLLIHAPGTIARLDVGANLLLANSGRGVALLELASLFPRSRFFGLEFSLRDLAAARDEAQRRGRQNIWFEASIDALPFLAGIFHIAVRQQPAGPGIGLAGISRLLQEGGLLIDHCADDPDTQQFSDANLTIRRSVIVPDGFCTIARK